MKTRKVIILTLPNGIFGNGGQTWLSIDLAPTVKLLENRGFKVQVSTVDRTDELDLRPTDIVMYSSCEAPEIREYMKDAFYFLRDRCILIPDYDFLLAYENKGFQELKRKSLGIGNLSGSVHYDLDGKEKRMPYVFKKISGAGSGGVHLVHTPADETKLKRKYFRVSLRRKLALLHRRFALKRDHYQAYRYRHKGFLRFVSQEFVPHMDHDYKILVFGDRFFGLKRNVRNGDFRASGSGDFDFLARIPDEVLEFAANIAKQLKAPQLSLDIVESPTGCHLIEYQALNFGPTTLTLSKGYYSLNRERNIWEWTEAQSDLGECFAHSVVHYFDKQGIIPH